MYEGHVLVSYFLSVRWWPDSWRDLSSGSANRWPNRSGTHSLEGAFSSQARTHFQTFYKNSCVYQHHNKHAPIHTDWCCCTWGWHFSKAPLPVPHCLPHNCTADALASTGALFWKDHLSIFRFWNLRALACDWLCWPHDNLGTNRSCVLSPSVSLEGSWGVFGGLGRPLKFNITGKQRKGEKAQISIYFLHACIAFQLLGIPSFPSFAAIWIHEDSWLRI